jgi:hypothetical protein
MAFTLYENLCNPGSSITGCSTPSSFCVLHILTAGNFSQVITPIIEWIPVDVINLHALNGPTTTDPSKNNNPVRVSGCSMNGKLMTPVAAIASQWAVVIAAVKCSSEWIVGILIPQLFQGRANVRL